MDKTALRKEMKEISTALSSQYKEKSSAEICRLLTREEFFLKAKNIFVYISTADEPDTKEIIKTAFDSNKNIFVPKCISASAMVPVKINKNTKMVKGYKGITEPEIIPDENTDDIHLDLCIIPCVSASYDGKRLGHGAGFYDRFLQDKNTLKVCLCFDKRISPLIPETDTDIPMDAVITEKAIYRIL